MSSKHRGYPYDEDIDDPDDVYIRRHEKLQSKDVWDDSPIVNEDEEDQKQKDLEDEGGPSWCPNQLVIRSKPDELVVPSDEDEDKDTDEEEDTDEESEEEEEEVEKKEAEEKEKEEKLSKKFSKMRASK